MALEPICSSSKGADLARVGLAGDGEGFGKAESLGDHAVELVAFAVIAVEEGEERGLGAGGALDAAELESGDAVLELVEVDGEVLGPERRPLADGGELGGLEVGVAEGGQVLPLQGEGAEGIDHIREPPAQQRHRVAHDDQVGVVDDVLEFLPELTKKVQELRGVSAK